MNKISECFDLYLHKLKWPIIAVRPLSKQPALSNWQKSYNPWRHKSYITKTPNANIGLLLGKIIDVEADTPRSNKLLEQLLGDYPHMRYASYKSIHHLFLSPFPHMTRVIIKGIEFRGKNHQSLLPPSTHPNGIKYRWLRPTTWKLTEMPHELRKLCTNKEAVRIKTTKLTTICCNVCNENYTLPVSLVSIEIEAFKSIGQNWQCRKCRTSDLRDIRRQIRRNGHKSGHFFGCH